MKKIELLAPAGDMQCLVAAINAGCDAVYLGGNLFGARSFAGNFSNEELIEAIKYAHIYGVKVYVTTNTLVYENEVSVFLEYIDFLHKNNVDAIIIQDIGMLDLIRKTYPNLEIHASTQMHIHNLEGVKFLQELGVKRIVLARETSILKIKEIKEKTQADLEVFVHGALCVSYSGQCLMSSLIGDRSGNRGTCTQNCRKQYKLNNESGYFLSMKDLNNIKNVGKLIDIGVDSLKIEGRMKSPEYVYLIVSLYRKAIDNYYLYSEVNITDNDILNMKKIFNRKFTNGFLFDSKDVINKKRPNHIGVELGKVIDYKKNEVTIELKDTLNRLDGIRIIGKKDYGFIVDKILENNKSVEKSMKTVKLFCKEEVEIGSLVVKTTDYLLTKEINKMMKIDKKIPINIKVILKENLKIIMDDGINNVYVVGNKIQKSINNSITKDRIEQQISKLGNTPFSINKLEIEMDENIFINIKDVNELRREAVDLLIEKRIYDIPYLKKEYSIDVKDYKIEKNINVLNETNKQIDGKYIYGKNGIKKLPRVINELLEYNEPLLVGELGSVYKYNNIDTDFSLNVVNSYSVAFLHSLGVKKITLSLELSPKQIKLLIESYIARYNRKPNVEVIVYGRLESMILKNKMNDGYLIDSFNNKYLIKRFSDYTVIYDYKIRDDKFNYFEIGVNNIRYNYIKELDF